MTTRKGEEPISGAAATPRQQAPRSHRVCILTVVHPADDVRIYHKQAASLARAGYQVTLVAPRGTTLRPEFGVRIVGVRVPRGRFLRMTLGVGLIAARGLGTGAAAFHLHDPELLPAGLVLKILGRRVVYDVHEDYGEQTRSKHYLPVFLRGVVGSLVGSLEKAIAVWLDGVVCATDAIAAKFYCRAGGLLARCGRVVIVRNYPWSSVAGSGQPPVVRSLGPRHPFRLVHLASGLAQETGVTSMVRAMALLDDRFELVLAGGFETPEYEATVRALPGFRRVRYVEPVPHERVWELYDECDAGLVCLMPLERYKVSLPVKMFEFLAAGLPVIASDFPLFREIIEGNRCGLCVDTQSPEQVAGAIWRLQNDPGTRRELGENGRRAVVEKYNWQSEAERLLALYRALLGPVPAGSELADCSQDAHDTSDEGRGHDFS